MNAKEILEKLKMTFNELVNNADAPVVPEVPVATTTKAKLADGTEVEVTTLEVGGIVTIAGAPAPVGDHTLEDGTVLTVGDNGAITAIVPVEEPVMEDLGRALVNRSDMGAKKKMGYEEIFSAFQTSTNEKFASYEAKFADYEVRLGRATKVIEGLMSLTQVLADTPTGTADPIVTKTNNFKTDEPVMKDYRGLFNK